MSGIQYQRQSTVQRRTRPQMRQETRTKLLDAAMAMVVEGGTAAASLRGICERAGYSQGAFYAYFSNKDDILITLVEEHMGDLAQSFEMIVRDASDIPLAALLASITARLDTVFRDTKRTLLLVELHLHARRDPIFRSRFEPVKAAYEQAFANVTTHLLERTVRASSKGGMEVAQTLLALWSGSILQGENPSTATSRIRHVFEAIIEMNSTIAARTWCEDLAIRD